MLLQHLDSNFDVLGLQEDAKEARNKMGIPKVGKQHPFPVGGSDGESVVHWVRYLGSNGRILANSDFSNHLYLALPLEFRQDLWRRKTRVLDYDAALIARWLVKSF